MPTTYDPDALLDAVEIAERIKCTDRMAHRLLYERRVPVVRVGRGLRVRRHDLEAWIDANTLPAVIRR